MSVPPWFDAVTGWAGQQQWVLWCFALLVAVGIVDLLQRRIVRRLVRHAERTRNTWDDVLVAGLGGPVSLLIWLLGAAVAARIAGAHSDAAVFDYVVSARHLGVILAVTWFALRLVDGLERGLSHRYLAADAPGERGPDRTTIDAIGKLLRAAVAITALLVAMQTLGYSISGVLAFGGVGGIAIGFAARDLLANFFGSIMIHLDRPFAVGDWVRSPDRALEGTVEYIGWRVSRVRTFDARPLYVPNAVFSNIIVENPSRMTHRRIQETVGIRYCDIGAMNAIVDDVRSMLETHGDIDAEQPLIVNFDQFAPSSVDFFIYALTTETRWIPFHALKQSVLLEVADIVARHGAEIAYPTSTLHLASMPDADTPAAAVTRPRAGAVAATGVGSGRTGDLDGDGP